VPAWGKLRAKRWTSCGNGEKWCPPRRARRCRQRGEQGRTRCSAIARLLRVPELAFKTRIPRAWNGKHTRDEGGRVWSSSNLERRLARVVLDHIIHLLLEEKQRHHINPVERGGQVERRLASRILSVERCRLLLEYKLDGRVCSVRIQLCPRAKSGWERRTLATPDSDMKGSARPTVCSFRDAFTLGGSIRCSVEQR
jgi:hypothetical protein